jgi:hypothetical protein
VFPQDMGRAWDMAARRGLRGRSLTAIKVRPTDGGPCGTSAGAKRSH